MRIQTCLCVFFTSVGFALTAGSALPAADAADRPDFVSLRSAWALDLHDQQIDKSLDLYASDAVFMTADGRRIAGRPAIRALFSGAMHAFHGTIAFTSMSTDISGNLAYDSGLFDEVLVDVKNGTSMRSRGSYLTVYRHSAQNWLIVEQVWTGNEPHESAH
jgi:ketosteroid isomerase-like protein